MIGGGPGLVHANGRLVQAVLVFEGHIFAQRRIGRLFQVILTGCNAQQSEQHYGYLDLYFHVFQMHWSTLEIAGEPDGVRALSRIGAIIDTLLQQRLRIGAHFGVETGIVGPGPQVGTCYK
ncbi:hypothetical protein D3C87_1825800 [compost metagenome]